MDSSLLRQTAWCYVIYPKVGAARKEELYGTSTNTPRLSISPRAIKRVPIRDRKLGGTGRLNYFQAENGRRSR